MLKLVVRKTTSNPLGVESFGIFNVRVRVSPMTIWYSPFAIMVSCSIALRRNPTDDGPNRFG
jgi:hypothetical protein